MLASLGIVILGSDGHVQAMFSECLHFAIIFHSGSGMSLLTWHIVGPAILTTPPLSYHALYGSILLAGSFTPCPEPHWDLFSSL